MINPFSIHGVAFHKSSKLFYTYDQSIFPFTHQIWGQDNQYYHNYNYESIKNSIASGYQTAYVDPVNGNDSNTGLDSTLPKKSIFSAWYNNASVRTIIVKPGFYDVMTGTQAVAITRPISIICPDGIAYVTTAHDPANMVFSVDGSNPNTYKATYAPTYIPSGMGYGSSAIDLTNVDSKGLPVRLIQVTSAALVSTTPGSIYMNSSTKDVWVRLWDDRAPDSNFKYLKQHTNFRSSDNVHNVYIENCYFWGGQATGGGVGLIKNTSTTTKKYAVFVNSRFDYGNDQGMSTFDNVEFVFIGGGSSYNYTDGLDYRNVNLNFFEYNVSCNWNGRDHTAKTHNGSTAHYGVKGIRVLGNYEYNKGRTMHDISNTTTSTASYNLACTAGNSLVVSGVEKQAFAGGINSGDMQTKMWFINCIATGDHGGWQAYANTTFYIKGGNYTGKTNDVALGTVVML